MSAPGKLGYHRRMTCLAGIMEGFDGEPVGLFQLGYLIWLAIGLALVFAVWAFFRFWYLDRR